MIGVRTIGTAPEDSFAACLASILELPADVVPTSVPPFDAADQHERKNTPGLPRPAGAWETWMDWLCNFGLVLWEYNREEGLAVPPGYGIATYLTERGFYSVVVYQRKTVWDPHRARLPVGELGEPVAVALILCVDPADLARELPQQSPSVLATLRQYVRHDR